MLSRLDLHHIPVTHRLPDRLGFLGAASAAARAALEEVYTLASQGSLNINESRWTTIERRLASDAIRQPIAREYPGVAAWLSYPAAIDSSRGRGADQVSAAFARLATEAGKIIDRPAVDVDPVAIAKERGKVEAGLTKEQLQARFAREKAGRPFWEEATTGWGYMMRDAGAVAGRYVTETARGVVGGLADTIPWYLWVAGAVGLGAVVYVGVVRR